MSSLVRIDRHLLFTPAGPSALFFLVHAGWWVTAHPLLWGDSGLEWGLVVNILVGLTPVITLVTLPVVSRHNSRTFLFTSCVDCPVGLQVLAAWMYAWAGLLAVGAYALVAHQSLGVAALLGWWSWVTLALRASAVESGRRELPAASI